MQNIFVQITFVALCAFATLAGCSIPLVQQSTATVVKGVKGYCAEVPPLARQATRQSVNAALEGVATICIQCAGDQPDESCKPPKSPPQ